MAALLPRPGGPSSLPSSKSRLVSHYVTIRATLLSLGVHSSLVVARPAQVVDMPLLFETGAYRLMRPRVLVVCDAQTQLQRLMARDASALDAAEARIKAQMPIEAKRKLADVVIENSGDLEGTREQAGPRQT